MLYICIAIKIGIETGKVYGEKVIIAYIKYETDSSNDYLEKLKHIFFVLSMNDLKQEYEYIYDLACDVFDNKFKAMHLCNFKEDSCDCQREDRVSHKTMGCCYEFYYKWDGIPVYTGKCKYLSDKGCTIKCLGCKIFTCRYLKKKGIYFSCKDVFLLDVFLDKKIQQYTNTTYFKTREEIIGYWMKHNKI